MMVSAGKHYRVYDEFARDLSYDNQYPFIHYPEEYSGEKIIKLCALQLHLKVNILN